jgi:nitric oxide reductase NorD protein
VGDRLCEVSPVLAQRYYVRAPAAWMSFGADGFARWVELGERLVKSEPSCRDGAMAYFAVSPSRFGRGGLDTAESWCRWGGDLALSSQKLAGIFFRTTASILRRPHGPQRLRAWVEVALELYENHGWQGEFLAQAYLAAAPRAVLTLFPSAYRLWAGAGAAIYPAVKEREFFEQLPRALQTWTEDEQVSFLRTTLALAAAAPRAAHVFYRDLPPSLGSLDTAARRILLGILVRVAKRVSGALAENASTIGALLRQVPEADRLDALALVDSVAGRCPEAAMDALKALPRVYEEATPAIIDEWFRRGLEVAADNLQAGLAYFALQSRTSLRVLRAASTAACLDDAQSVLRKYVQMLSGEPVSIRPEERMRLRPPLEEFPEENEIGLPMRIDRLGTLEENLRLYRFLAAQLAGRREFGTYDFVPPGGDADPSAPVGSALVRYLEAQARTEALEDLFLLAEGVRIHHRLCAAYGGLAAEGSWVAKRLLNAWGRDAIPTRGRRLDALLALALLDDPAVAAPGWLDAGAAALALRLLAPLASAEATVQDSMRVAHVLAAQLARPVLGDREGDVDGFVLDDASGAALLDPYFEDYEEAPLRSEPPRAEVETPTRKAAPTADEIPLDLTDEPDVGAAGAQPISPDELKKLLEAGVDLRIAQGSGSDVDGLGLYITDLIGKVPREQLDALRELLGGADDGTRRPARRWVEERAQGTCFWYDEWDYHIGDYRSRWCRLYEMALAGDSGEFFNETLTDYARLIPEVRRQFQRLRPEMYRTVRGLEDGEDFDLNAAIEARIEARTGRSPSSKLYVARKREERDVATLFLVDMSASTDEPLQRPGSTEGEGPMHRGRSRQRPRRIIDVTKETLVIMAGALEEIGDAYAIYGFSGHGRDHVEMYRVKSFSEALNAGVKSRLGGIEPRRSTRMGTALRHAVEKLAGVSSRSKHLFLLSDGFPQDYDYGQDRRSNVYGIRDTAVALREAETAGITPFCITVDKAGHDYLRQMCDESRYMVIEDIAALPRELPKIYQRVVRA